MSTKHSPATRHIVSINDLTDREIETVFDVAQSFLRELPDSHFPYRIGRSTKIASDCILASLFYEPSTRTRLSFESAMLRLGGETITSADPATSSAAKGESLADSVRVIANYADIMVIRHPRDMPLTTDVARSSNIGMKNFNTRALKPGETITTAGGENQMSAASGEFFR